MANTTTIQFSEIEYTGRDGAHEAIGVEWDEIVRLLGDVDRSGVAAGVEQVRAALLASGAPEWVRDAEGWTDESWWGLIGPARRSATVVLGRNGMGDQADEADFDAWTAYVSARINEATGLDVTVEQHGERDVQSTTVRADGDLDVDAIRSALAALWDAFCADDSAWPARETDDRNDDRDAIIRTLADARRESGRIYATIGAADLAERAYRIGMRIEALTADDANAEEEAADLLEELRAIQDEAGER